jgi:hypothetical protein
MEISITKEIVSVKDRKEDQSVVYLMYAEKEPTHAWSRG